jgi:hypothetical protein
MNHVVTLGLILAGSAAVADHYDSYEVKQFSVCSDQGSLFASTIMQEYGESILFTGDGFLSTLDETTQGKIDRQGTVFVLTNQDTGTYTVLIAYPWGTVCEVISGVNFEPYIGERK